MPLGAIEDRSPRIPGPFLLYSGHIPGAGSQITYRSRNGRLRLEKIPYPAMSQRALKVFPAVLRYALLCLALLFFLELLLLAPFRIGYPYDLEWMEGAFVDQVRRVLSGQPLYVKPSLEFTSYIYPPFYFYLSALVSRLTGVGYLPLRLLALLSSLGCFALIFQLSRRETGSAFYGTLSAALYAACFELGGAWFDLARLDCTLLLLLLAAVYLLRFYPSLAGALLSGGILALASFTKQSALIVAIPLCLYGLAARGTRFGLVMAGSFALPVIAVTGLLQWSSDGWYALYVFELPRQHPYFTPVLVLFWTHDLFLPLPVAFLSICGFLFSRFKGRSALCRDERDALLLQATFLAATLGASWLSRLHIGGANNGVLPAYAAISLLFGPALQWAFSRFEDRSGAGGEAAAAAPGPRTARLLLYAAAIYQFASLVYNPLDYLPTRRDLQAGEAFVRALSDIEGEVFAPDHGYVPVRAGKKTYPHVSTFWSVWAGDDGRVKDDLNAEIDAALRRHRFAAVIIDAPGIEYPPFMRRIEKHYRPAGRLLKGDLSFSPINTRRLEIPSELWIYLPR